MIKHSSKTPLIDALMANEDKILQLARIMEEVKAHPAQRRSRRYVVRNPDGSIYRPKKRKLQ